MFADPTTIQGSISRGQPLGVWFASSMRGTSQAQYASKVLTAVSILSRPSCSPIFVWVLFVMPPVSSQNAVAIATVVTPRNKPKIRFSIMILRVLTQPTQTFYVIETTVLPSPEKAGVGGSTPSLATTFQSLTANRSLPEFPCGAGFFDHKLTNPSQGR